MTTHFQWMQRALHLASKGRGFTSPNPMVGAVLVKNHHIIGEGYHEKFGGPHAEVIALRQAGKEAKGATLYVTLEPCSHQGKTPPCAPQVIQAGVTKVYISMIDPNPLVNQKGIRMLKNAGIKVYTGLLEKEARDLNRGFISLMEKKRPWVTLKMAQTADGYIADLSGKSQWITSPPAREFVMSQRALHDGIMIGLGTVLKDNPGLLPAKRDAYIPWRIILAETLRMPDSLKILTDDYTQRTIILTGENAEPERLKYLTDQGLKILTIPADFTGKVSIPKALELLAEQGIASVYCEGGGQIAGTLIREGLCDELQLFVAPKVLGQGLPVFGGFAKNLDQAVRLKWEDIQRIGPDLLVRGRLDSCLQD